MLAHPDLPSVATMRDDLRVIAGEVFATARQGDLGLRIDATFSGKPLRGLRLTLNRGDPSFNEGTPALATEKLVIRPYTLEEFDRARTSSHCIDILASLDRDEVVAALDANISDDVQPPAGLILARYVITRGDRMKHEAATSHIGDDDERVVAGAKYFAKDALAYAQSPAIAVGSSVADSGLEVISHSFDLDPKALLPLNGIESTAYLLQHQEAVAQIFSAYRRKLKAAGSEQTPQRIVLQGQYDAYRQRLSELSKIIAARNEQEGVT